MTYAHQLKLHLLEQVCLSGIVCSTEIQDELSSTGFFSCKFSIGDNNACFLMLVEDCGEEVEFIPLVYPRSLLMLRSIPVKYLSGTSGLS